MNKNNDLPERIVHRVFSCVGCFGVSIFAILGLCMLGVDCVTARDLLYQWKTSTYLETAGTVTHSKVKVSSDGEGTSYTPVIHYDYTVNGEQYTGKKYKFSPPTFSKGSARRLVAEFPVGKIVPVYYCPTQPQRTVLCRGLDIRDSFLPLFLMPFNGVMLIVIYGLLKCKFRRYFRNKERWFRDFPIQTDGLTLRLRISSHDPIATTIVGTLPAIFVALPFCFVFDGFDEIAIWIGWGAFLLGGLYGFWLAGRWNRSGLYDLVIDKMYGELILPRQPDKTPGPVVPFDSIEDITLSKIAAESSDDRDNHILTLHYRSGNETKSAVIASNHNWVVFLSFLGDSFTDDDVETELTELKNWILRETGRAVL